MNPVETAFIGFRSFANDSWWRLGVVAVQIMASCSLCLHKISFLPSSIHIYYAQIICSFKLFYSTFQHQLSQTWKSNCPTSAGCLVTAWLFSHRAALCDLTFTSNSLYGPYHVWCNPFCYNLPKPVSGWVCPDLFYVFPSCHELRKGKRNYFQHSLSFFALVSYPWVIITELDDV